MNLHESASLINQSQSLLAGMRWLGGHQGMRRWGVLDVGIGLHSRANLHLGCPLEHSDSVPGAPLDKKSINRRL